MRLDREHNLGRHLRAKDYVDDQVSRSAFTAKQGDDHLSIYHLDYFATRDLNGQLRCVQRLLNAAKQANLEGGREVRDPDRFAVLSVGAAYAAVAQKVPQARIDIRAAPLAGAEFHAGIFGYQADQTGAFVALALAEAASLSPPMRQLPKPPDQDCAPRDDPDRYSQIG